VVNVVMPYLLQWCLTICCECVNVCCVLCGVCVARAVKRWARPIFLWKETNEKVDGMKKLEKGGA